MNDSNFTIPLSKVIEEFSCEKIYESTDIDKVLISTADVNRPALQIVGFYDYFDVRRIQVMGKVELTYLEQFPAEKREALLAELFKRKIPCLVITRGMQIPPEMGELAKRYDVTLLRTEEATSDFMSALISYLNVQIAPRRTRHGVLVEVYGEGLLLLGESGVGKSEAAIELVKRGHRLIADDAVEIHKAGEHGLEGTAPELIRHYIELRGIGVINVAKLFGMGSVKDSSSIDMVINLEQWSDTTTYDRLGIEDQHTTILGVDVPSLVIPVKPGRNLAVILEVAAMNNRQKRLGYNAALEFTEQINRHFDESMS